MKGNHVDVFCGATSANCLPGVVASDDKHTFDAVVITDADICLFYTSDAADEDPSLDLGVFRPP